MILIQTGRVGNIPITNRMLEEQLKGFFTPENQFMQDVNGADVLVTEGKVLPQREVNMLEELGEYSPFFNDLSIIQTSSTRYEASFLDMQQNVLSVAESANITGTGRDVQVSTRGMAFNLDRNLGNVYLDYEVLRQAIAKDLFQETLLSKLAKQVGNQLEREMLHGNTTLPSGALDNDPTGNVRKDLDFFRRKDGLIRTAIAGVDFNTAPNTPADLPSTFPASVVNSLPTKFQAEQFDGYIYYIPVAQFNKLCATLDSTTLQNFPASVQPLTSARGNNLGRQIVYRSGLTVRPLQTLSQVLTYTPAGGSATTYTNKNTGLFINPAHIVAAWQTDAMVGNGGLSISVKNDPEKRRVGIHFDIHFGYGMKYLSHVRTPGIKDS